MCVDFNKIQSDEDQMAHIIDKNVPSILLFTKWNLTREQFSCSSISNICKTLGKHNSKLFALILVMEGGNFAPEMKA